MRRGGLVVESLGWVRERNHLGNRYCKVDSRVNVQAVSLLASESPASLPSPLPFSQVHSSSTTASDSPPSTNPLANPSQLCPFLSFSFGRAGNEAGETPLGAGVGNGTIRSEGGSATPTRSECEVKQILHNQQSRRQCIDPNYKDSWGHLPTYQLTPSPTAIPLSPSDLMTTPSSGRPSPGPRGHAADPRGPPGRTYTSLVVLPPIGGARVME